MTDADLPNLDTLAARLRWALDRSNLNGSEVADRVGVTKSAVSQWLTGDSGNIKLETFFAVAHVLGINAEWLATGRASPVPAYASEHAIALALEIDRLAPEIKAAVLTLVAAMRNIR